MSSFQLLSVYPWKEICIWFVQPFGSTTRGRYW